MGKIVFWIVIFFLVLFALRMWNVAKARSARKRRSAAPPSPQAMVRCVQCGVFLPMPDARTTPKGYRCAEPGCIEGRPR